MGQFVFSFGLTCLMFFCRCENVVILIPSKLHGILARFFSLASRLSLGMLVNHMPMILFTKIVIFEYAAYSTNGLHFVMSALTMWCVCLFVAAVQWVFLEEPARRLADIVLLGCG